MRRAEMLYVALILALLAAPAVFLRGGVLEAEAIDFFERYWAREPVAERILDSRVSDEYQSRELSYAIDFLDAQWMKALLGRGITWFIPPSAVFESLLIVAAWLWGAPRALCALDRASVWLLLALYLSNFAVLSTMGICYRATKPLVAPLVLFVLLFVLREYRRPHMGRGAALAIVGVSGFLISLRDRQGFLDVATVAAALLLIAVVRRRGLHLALGAAVATVAALAYDKVFGPWLIHRVCGYWPRMGFQRIDVGRVLGRHPWIEGVALLRDWTSVLLGGLPVPLVLAGAAALAVLCLVRWKGFGTRGSLFVPVVLLMAVASQVGMSAVMVARHAPVTWIDHRAWYYPLPFQAILLFGLAWGLERWALAREGGLPRVVPIALLALVVANVARWPELRQRMQSGPWFSYVSRDSAAFKRSVEAGSPDPLLDDGYRRFFFDCLARFPRLGARAGAYVRETDDVEEPWFREGRLFAWARRQTHLAAFAPHTGTCLMEGGFRVRPGERISVFREGGSSSLLAEVVRSETLRGPSRYPSSSPWTRERPS